MVGLSCRTPCKHKPNYFANAFAFVQSFSFSSSPHFFVSSPKLGPKKPIPSPLLVSATQ